MGALWSGLLLIVGPLIYKIAAAIGLGFVTYTGVDFVMTYLENYVHSNLSGAAPNIVAMLGLLGVDRAVSLIFSAVAVRATLSGWTAIGKRSSIWKTPG